MYNDLLLPDPAKTHRYMTTYTGKQFRLTGLLPGQVDIEDIVHALPQVVRYQGMCDGFYSVAEHSVLVARMARAAGYREKVVRACLLHDAHEAYVGDFPSPFKVIVPGLKSWETDVELVVREALNLPSENWSGWHAVKHFDILALHVEANSLFTPVPEWVDPALVIRAEKLLDSKDPILCVQPDKGEAYFREAAGRLGIVGL